MAKVDFAEALNQPIDTIERPQNPPLGTYLWRISKLPVFSAEKKDKNGNRYQTIDVPCVAVRAVDVEPELLEEWGGKVEGINGRVSFFFDLEDEVKFDGAKFRAKQFFEEHCKCEGGSIREMAANSVNAQFQSSTRYRADQNDPEIMYFEIDRTAPVA